MISFLLYHQTSSVVILKSSYQGKDCMKKVTVYTDGACSGNPGPGGWCAILVYMDKEKILSGGKSMTTNNEMELTAVVQALSTLKESCEVEVYSDSQYVVNAVNKRWIYNWRKNGWKNSKKETLPNLLLWQEFDRLISIHTVSFTWVRGHAGNTYNERCDQIAVSERNNYA